LPSLVTFFSLSFFTGTATNRSQAMMGRISGMNGSMGMNGSAMMSGSGMIGMGNTMGGMGTMNTNTMY
tara:strand:+ start:102 stop:305 length:204 start_codon:yes stop_codon:yes gene_type:complete